MNTELRFESERVHSRHVPGNHNHVMAEGLVIVKNTALFVCGLAVSYFVMKRKLEKIQSGNTCSESSKCDDTSNNEDEESEGDSGECANDQYRFEAHKMVLCVRMDLNMGKG